MATLFASSEWAADDHAAAFAVFQDSARAMLSGSPELRSGLAPSNALLHVAKQAADAGSLARSDARRFFETYLKPATPLEGFMTGYYEPEFEARTAPDGVWLYPLRRPPSSLADLPDRADIENGLIDRSAPPFVWFRDPLEPFLIQVQGSARLDLGAGAAMRLIYAGRNGKPYTSIGKALVEAGVLSAADVDLEAIRRVFAADPDLARSTMRLNRSYVFFNPRPVLETDGGPIGAQGLALTPQRSVAIDRTLYSYGTLIWLNGQRPSPERDQIFSQLCVAQDTGSAIVGAGRVDLFWGHGLEAEALAGRTRHGVGFTMLEPVL